MKLLVRIIEVIIFGGLVLLQWLVPQKMGVMRSMQYRHLWIENNIFSFIPEMAVFVIIILVLIVLIGLLIKKCRSNELVWWLDLILSIATATLLMISRQQAWYLYYGFMFMAIIVIVTQGSSLWLQKRKV